LLRRPARSLTLLDDGEPVAVVLSPQEFERLDEQDRIRREAKARLRNTIAAVQAEAAKSGLADAKIDQVFAD
jgi:PHD/YefM family antitoxin component YafN of YafNO toxin-antitoxin module